MIYTDRYGAELKIGSMVRVLSLEKNLEIEGFTSSIVHDMLEAEGKTFKVRELSSWGVLLETDLPEYEHLARWYYPASYLVDLHALAARRRVAADKSLAQAREVKDTPVVSSVGTGLKYDGNKPRPTLLLEGVINSISALIAVLEYGAKKYEAHSWQKVENGIKRYEDAALRHMLLRLSGQEKDDESGMYHLVHEIISKLFVLELKIKKGEYKDVTVFNEPPKI